MADLVSPNKTRETLGYEGWAYCARTPDRDIFLLYFERGCPRSQVRGARLNAAYRARWFNVRDGAWLDAGAGLLGASRIGVIALPQPPSDADWGLSLVREGARADTGK
jgi:hypothetical protein